MFWFDLSTATLFDLSSWNIFNTLNAYFLIFILSFSLYISLSFTLILSVTPILTHSLSLSSHSFSLSLTHSLTLFLSLTHSRSIFSFLKMQQKMMRWEKNYSYTASLLPATLIFILSHFFDKSCVLFACEKLSLSASKRSNFSSSHIKVNLLIFFFIFFLFFFLLNCFKLKFLETGIFNSP